MISSRYPIFLVIGPLLGWGWLVLLAANPDRARGVAEYPAIGYLLGTVFAQATLAAVWTAFGPLKLLYRLPLALTWLAVLWIGLVINLSMGSGGPDDVLPLLALLLFGQWLFVQMPLWGLAFYYGLRLRHASDSAGERSERQFGIRQLMILTFIVAVVLGIGRALLTAGGENSTRGMDREAPVFIFLAVAAIVMSLPLVMAILLPRWSLVATPVVLILIIVGTAWELPLLSQFPTPGGGPNQWHFIWINGFTSAWVLAILGLLRIGGYQLAGQGVAEPGRIAAPGNAASHAVA